MQIETYYRNRLIETANTLKSDYMQYILTSAKRNNINPEVLCAIILVEMINRGSWINKWIEKILIKTFPFLLIKKDASLGVSQIKISLATKMMPEYTAKEVLEALMDDKINIDLCAKHIKKFEDTVSDDLNSNYFNQLVNYYIAGKLTISNRPPHFLLYENLIKWSVSQKVFSSLCFKVDLTS